jgi:hypothetical protein
VKPSRRYPTRTPLAEAWNQALARPWVNLLLLAVLVKLALVLVTLFAYGAAPDPLAALGRAWDQWDARHYLYLATHGYSAGGDAKNLIAFFPLYPALIGAVASLGLPARLAALLISNVTGVIAAILLYEVARVDRDEKTAFRAAAFFTVFPTAYFLLVGYTEALFCALAFGAVLAARRQHWLASGMLGGLAAAARLTGIALIPFLLIEMAAHRRRLASVGQALIPPLLTALGIAVYLATNQLVLGNPFAFIAVQRQHWSHTFSAPWVGFASAVRSITWRVPWEKLTVGAGEIAGGMAAYATATLSWLRLRPADAAYASVVTVMVTFLPFWLSIPRYLLSIYPLFLLAGRIRNVWLYRSMLAGSSLALLVLASLFIAGYWAF